MRGRRKRFQKVPENLDLGSWECLELGTLSHIHQTIDSMMIQAPCAKSLSPDTHREDLDEVQRVGGDRWLRKTPAGPAGFKCGD